MEEISLSEKGRLRPVNKEDLERILAWRNHPEVRRFMYSQHMITMQEHLRWYESLQNNSFKRAFVFELAGVPSGFVSFSLATGGHVADWGFYVAPGSSKGTGGKLGRTALQYAFTVMQLHKVCGQALYHNERSIRFHERLGFLREGTLRDQYFDGSCYHSIVCFGLLAREWQSRS